MSRNSKLMALVAGIAITVFALVAIGGSLRSHGSGSATAATDEHAAAAGPGGQAAEMQDGIRARLDSLRAAPSFTATDTAEPRVQTPGWAKEQLFSNKNDWEPNVATDPNSPYVYMITTEYGGPSACGTCPSGGVIRMRVSSDGGHTFGPPTFLCPCPGHNWQADPQIEVDGNGDVYAAWLTNPFGTVFSRSTDHGATWTDPVEVLPPSHDVPWNDHPWLAVSSDGQDVYIGVNHADNLQVSSHDYGATWSAPVQTNTDGNYYFSEGGAVLPNGDVVFSASAYGCCPYNQYADKRPTDVYTIRSDDGGDTWTQQQIDVGATMPLCKTAGCPPAQYGAQASIAADDSGNLMVAYNAGNKARAPQKVFIRTSTDSGVTWSGRARLSPNVGANAIYPQIAARQDGRFAVAWADSRNGGGRYQTWERDTFDGGQTWSADAQISNLGQGAPYKQPAGYGFNYGDYFDIAINNVDEAFSAWGEANSYNGPGNTWWNVQTTG